MPYVYHPKAWLQAMPKDARFYPSKDDLRTEHPGTLDRDIVQAVYHGPVDEANVVLKPKAPAPAQEDSPAPAPVSAPAEKSPSVPAKKSVKKTSNKKSA